MGDCVPRKPQTVQTDKIFREAILRDCKIIEEYFRDQDPVDEETNTTGTTEDSKRIDNIPRNKL